MCKLKNEKKPLWLKTSLKTDPSFGMVTRVLADMGLNTVCAEARCPNRAQCWNDKTATFMILGDCCTRGCRFCAVDHSSIPREVDPSEPERIAKAVDVLGIKHAVITSVSRDDLADGGSLLFAAVISALKKLSGVSVEVLTPDYQGLDLRRIIDAGPDVFAHNIEVVKRLSPHLRHERFSYEKSLKTLNDAYNCCDFEVAIKSSLMLGLGEEYNEVLDAMNSLRTAGVSILVLGQYLRPSKEQAEVVRYLHPDEFTEFKVKGLEMGFHHILASPLARTSYKAASALSTS